jgi:NAD(P)-dependent dehydrogenase (short-subunit alcohol dehydrogenase family)
VGQAKIEAGQIFRCNRAILASLEGRTALVTGASKGIGKAIVLELVRAGCHVAVNYYSDAAGGGEVATGIRALGRRALSIRADVGVAADVDAMCAEVLRQFGHLDVLVNNAGTQVFKPLVELEERGWDRVIATNLKGRFLCTQRAARAMQWRDGGRIINIGSGCDKARSRNRGGRMSEGSS